MKYFGRKLIVLCKKIWGSLRRNFGLKLIALFFAILLWSIAMAEENPWREKNISNVSATVIGKDILAENDLAVTNGLSVLKDGVKLNIEVRQADYYTVENESISATVDLSFIREPGQYTVKVSTKGPNNGRVLDVNPSTVNVTVEKTATRTLPVSYTYEGELGENYWHGDPIITPNMIEISGPVSTVEKISRAVCNIPLTNLTSPFNEAVQVVFYDANGGIVDTGNLTNSVPTAIVNMDVLYKKSVPVQTDGNILDIDNVKAGYVVSDVEVTPKTVEIVGPIDKVNSITSVNFEAISVQNADATVVKAAKLLLPEGVTGLKDNSVNVVVSIKEKETEETFNKQLQYTELSSGLSAVLRTKVIEVKVNGPISAVKNFQPSDLKLYVNLAGLSEGVYDVPVEYSISNGNSALAINISTAVVSIVISKK